MSTNFVKCPSCGVNKIPVTKEGPESYPHGLCIQCLGQDHDPFKCAICSVLPKGTIARRELQRKVWIHSGVFMSRAKAAVYLKNKGLDESYRHDLNVSLKSLNLSRSSVPEPSPVQVDIIAQGAETVPGPLIGFGHAVTGLVEHQLPFSVSLCVGSPQCQLYERFFG